MGPRIFHEDCVKVSERLKKMSIWNIPIVLALDKQVYDGFMNLLDWVEEVLLRENISH